MTDTVLSLPPKRHNPLEGFSAGEPDTMLSSLIDTQAEVYKPNPQKKSKRSVKRKVRARDADVQVQERQSIIRTYRRVLTIISWYHGKW